MAEPSSSTLKEVKVPAKFASRIPRVGSWEGPPMKGGNDFLVWAVPVAVRGGANAGCMDSETNFFGVNDIMQRLRNWIGPRPSFPRLLTVMRENGEADFNHLQRTQSTPRPRFKDLRKIEGTKKWEVWARPRVPSSQKGKGKSKGRGTKRPLSPPATGTASLTSWRARSASGSVQEVASSRASSGGARRRRSSSRTSSRSGSSSSRSRPKSSRSKSASPTEPRGELLKKARQVFMNKGQAVAQSKSSAPTPLPVPPSWTRSVSLGRGLCACPGCYRRHCTSAEERGEPRLRCSEPVGRRAESKAQRRCFACTDQLLPIGPLDISPEFAGLLALHAIPHGGGVVDERGLPAALLAFSTTVGPTGTQGKPTNREVYEKEEAGSSEQATSSPKATTGDASSTAAPSLEGMVPPQSGDKATVPPPALDSTRPSALEDQALPEKTIPSSSLENGPVSASSLCTSATPPLLEKDGTGGAAALLADKSEKREARLASPGRAVDADPSSQTPEPTAGSSSSLREEGELGAPSLAPRSADEKSFTPPEPPSPSGSGPRPARTGATGSSGSSSDGSSSAYRGELTGEEVRNQEQLQGAKLIERKRTLAELLRPREAKDRAERMRLSVLWIQCAFCPKCGEKWSHHTGEEECTCEHTLPLQLQEVEEELGAIPGLEDP